MYFHSIHSEYILIYVQDTVASWFLRVYMFPTWKHAIAWSLREMGSAWGKGVREEPAPQEAGKISSHYSAKARTTWARTRKTNQVGHDGGGPARTE